MLILVQVRLALPRRVMKGYCTTGIEPSALARISKLFSIILDPALNQKVNLIPIFNILKLACTSVIKYGVYIL